MTPSGMMFLISTWIAIGMIGSFYKPMAKLLWRSMPIIAGHIIIQMIALIFIGTAAWFNVNLEYANSIIPLWGEFVWPQILITTVPYFFLWVCVFAGFCFDTVAQGVIWLMDSTKDEKKKKIPPIEGGYEHLQERELVPDNALIEIYDLMEKQS